MAIDKANPVLTSGEKAAKKKFKRRSINKRQILRWLQKTKKSPTPRGSVGKNQVLPKLSSSSK